MVLTTYGRSSGFCVDPIEKKPLNHFYPGSAVLSFGTAGCNLACKFCQNWDISKSKDMDRLADQASPEAIAQAAVDTAAAASRSPTTTRSSSRSTRWTSPTPVASGAIQTVAVTAGYMHAQPRREFYAKMDAANVDLKGFTEEFYVKLTGAHLQPVLDTLVYLKHETNVWFEITTLLIPGRNDSDAEVRAQCQWIMKELGPDVPVHFTAFHPDYKMDDLPPTPAVDADPRAAHRAGGRPALRVHGQRARSGRRHDGVPCVPDAAHRARLAPHRELPPDRGRLLPRTVGPPLPAASKPSQANSADAAFPVAIGRPRGVC